MTGKTTDFTLATLANIPTSSEKGCLIHIGAANGSDGFSLGVGGTSFDNNGNNLIFETCPNNWTVIGPIGTGWKHLAVVVDSAGSVAGYVDSVQDPDIVATGDITAELEAAIDAASDGDTIVIGAGTCSMSNIVISDKNITIKGGGAGVTNITAEGGFGQWITNGSNSPTWRLSGISFSGTGQIIPLTVWADQAAAWRGPFRIDHCEFNYPAGGASVYLFGPIYGLIDHCKFVSSYELAILTGLQLSTESGSISALKGAFAASLAYEPGGAQNLYIEDCIFDGSSGSLGIAATDTGYTGTRLVFRHNTCINTAMYSHWTSDGNVNSLWWEVYDNAFSWDKGEDMYPMRLQGGGTGLIYNNTFTGFPANHIVVGEGRNPTEGQSGSPLLFVDGSHNWDGNAGDTSAPGWPALCQTGRNAGKTIAQIQAGNKQASFPLYLWNNGSFTVNSIEPDYIKATPHTVSGGGYGQGDVDYSVTTSMPSGAGTHTLTYTPYTYPHPMSLNP